MYQSELPGMSFAITSPRADWVFYTDMPIRFSTNSKSAYPVWQSSIDGCLGVGSTVDVLLSAGIHRITAVHGSSSDAVSITVVSRVLNTGEIRPHLLNAPKQSLYMDSGTYVPIVYTYNGSVSQLEMSAPVKYTADSYAAYEDDNHAGFGRNFSVACDIKTLVPLANVSFSRTAAADDMLVQERDFFVINTANQLAAPHIVRAELYAAGSTYTIWKPLSFAVDAAAVNTLIENIETLVIPRVCSVFGQWADINGDGKIAVLLCPTINQEQMAIGFFNSADLFIRNTDKTSDSYNPYSNELDMLYLAVPSAAATGNYSAASLSATVAHELTHNVTFNRKTFRHILAGDTQRKQEELFLDEGLSHLSENLCGFGVSGGNIVFLDAFLKDTGSYSLCAEDKYGRSDSVGRRGAMLLFLSWLYRQSADGDSFLRNILDSHCFGWECIGEALGTSTDYLFGSFVSAVATAVYTGEPFPYRTDSVTGEPVDFFCNMGMFEFGGKSYDIGIPRLYTSETEFSVLKYSVSFFDPVTFESMQPIVFSANGINGTVYAGMLKIE